MVLRYKIRKMKHLQIISYTLLLLSLLGFLSCEKLQEKQPAFRQYLHEGWQFSTAKSDTLYEAHVPGNNYSDLLAAGLIPDPFYADNEKKLQWVDEENWKYKLRFTPDDQLFEQDSIFLVMKGLDSYADIMLNDMHLLSTDNMFREYRISVARLLKKGENKLEILFRSPLSINKEKAAALPYQLPDNRVFTRKAPYQLGWDWGPELVCCGIWQPIYLEAATDFILKNLSISTLEISDKKAKMLASVQIDVFTENSIDFQLASDGGIVDAKFERNLEPGSHLVSFEFEIQEPRLWWPAGYGAQELYAFSLTASAGRNKEQLASKTGIRTSELIQEPDSYGTSFYLKINGLPIFAKGANYIPQDNLLNRVDSSRYQKLFERTSDANMNMLRVWGGGIYENDYFYQLADEHGILIWQDFMYACAMYPGDSAFLYNAKQEADYQVSRISTHPSVALWCGNNESDNGWKDWGWQKQYGYSQEDSSSIYTDYKNLFEGILPAAVKNFAPGIPYHPSSPTFGWGHPESLTQGDSHYWGIWWGMEDFERYNEKTGRFMSEYGFQGAPDKELLKKYIPEDQLQVYNPVLLAHQKHPTGNQTIDSYMKRYLPLPASFDEWLYLSQVLQAYGMEAGIRYHRMKKPFCMGTLYWQLNDCWPVISWSGLDYEYNKKALHFRAAEAFQTIMPWVSATDEKITIGINSDSPKSVEGRLLISKINSKGNVALIKDSLILLDALSNNTQLSLSRRELISSTAEELIYVCFQRSDDNLQFEYLHYFERPLDLELDNSTIHLGMQVKNDTIVLSSDILIKNICISSTHRNLELDNNYFDMIPGKEYCVKTGVENLRLEELSYRCLNDVGKN